MTRPHAVLFDFAGTLFAEQPRVDWIARAADKCGVTLDPSEARWMAQRHSELLRRPEHRDRQRGRDLGPSHHRQAVMPLLVELANGHRELAEALHASQFTDAYWTVFDSAPGVLRAVRHAGCRIAVVSNVPRDIRALFEARGLAGLVDAFVLSCECGYEKPDAAIFTAACDALAVAPTEALMVGNDPTSDGGAVALGTPVYLVPANGDGLAAVLSLVQAR